MTKLLWGVVPILAVVGVLGANRHDGSRQLKVVGGHTTISFFPSILGPNHLKSTIDSTAAGDPNTSDPSQGYKISASSMKYTLANGRLSKFEGGSIDHRGGFVLTSGNNKLDAHNFSITSSKTVNDGLQVDVKDASGTYEAFDLVNPRTLFDYKTNVMTIAYMDLVLSLQGAQKLGKPELAGKLVGTLSVFAESDPIDGRGAVEMPAPTPSPKAAAALDVALSNMGQLTDVGRTGTFPNGKNGMAMSTTSCNVGTQNIPWFAPMNVQHPAIAMNLYRLQNGRFEQIGWSWMKHGFFATNSSGCGTCQNPQTGTLLGPGCSDTYGVGNNGDRNYLGARDEINPFTGVWTCQGSYFSNYQNDCVRRNNGSGLDAVAHRLEVLDSDLNTTGAQFFYEAYYISANDNDRYNNIGSRQATFTWSGTTWNVNTIDSGQIQGPAINRWGEMRSTAQPTTEGDVIVAVQTTNLGNGMWHYEYAVYNHDLDRQVREFSVPMPAGATVQNIGFRDIDQDGTNEWTSALANEKLTWSTATFGSSTANPLKYSSVFNFRFDCNIAPVSGSANLGMFKPGTGTTLSAATKTPFVLSPVDTVDPVNATIFSGNLQSLAHSDDDKLGLTPLNDRFAGGVIVKSAAPAGAVTSFTVGVESSNSASTNDINQSIEMWNWSTSAWELIDNRHITTVDSVALVSVTSNASRFVNPSTQEVQARVMQGRVIANANNAGSRTRLMFDQIGFKFN